MEKTMEDIKNKIRKSNKPLPQVKKNKKISKNIKNYKENNLS
jgi:hypothetical protein